MRRMLPAVLLVLALVQYIQGECPGGCQHASLFYDTIKCKPIYNKPTDCCPTKYDCSNIEQNPANKCVLKGKFYEINQEIPKTETYPNCNIGCRCMRGPKINCAVLDCPEWLGYRPPPGCHLKYELDHCCSSGHLCPPFTEESKCKVGEKVYLEGERFQPPNKCISCVCKKGFKGEFIEPFCSKMTCGFEIRKSNDIASKCAPVFHNKDDCCPSDFVCLDSTDKIVPVAKTKQNPNLQCKYGNKILHVGDTFERTIIRSEFQKEETKCECSTPPFVTCIRKFIYDLEKAPEHMRPHLQ